MYRFFKKTRVMMICAWIITAIVILLTAVAFSDRSPLLLILFAVLIGFAFSLMWLGIFITASKEVDKVLRKLTDECDPEAYCKEYERFISFDKKFRFSVFLYTNFAVGLEASGSRDAISYTERAKNDRSFDRQSVIQKFVVYNNLATFYYDSGDFAKSEENLDLALEEYGKLNPKFQKNCEWQIETLESIRRVMHGDNSRYEEDLKKTFETGKSEKVRVNSMYDLGIFYRQSGNDQEEYKCMLYAATHGNKLYVAKKAAERVRELENGGTL